MFKDIFGGSGPLAERAPRIRCGRAILNLENLESRIVPNATTGDP